jgi:hypothetical protein
MFDGQIERHAAESVPNVRKTKGAAESLANVRRTDRQTDSIANTPLARCTAYDIFRMYVEPCGRGSTCTQTK